MGIENGRSGVSSSLTILGSQQGSVDRYGNYTPNENFLGEINGQDIADLIRSQQQRLNSADQKNPNDDKEEGPQGLVDLLFAGGALLMSGAVAWAAGGGSSAPSGEGNSGNAVVGRRPEDEDGSGEGVSAGGKGGLDADGGGESVVTSIKEDRQADNDLGIGLLSAFNLSMNTGTSNEAEDYRKKLKLVYDIETYRELNGVDISEVVRENGEKVIKFGNEKMLLSEYESIKKQAEDENKAMLKIADAYPKTGAEQYAKGLIKLDAEISAIKEKEKSLKATIEYFQKPENQDPIQFEAAKKELANLVNDPKNKQLLEMKKVITEMQNGVWVDYTKFDANEVKENLQFRQRREDAIAAVNGFIRGGIVKDPLDPWLTNKLHLDAEGFDHVLNNKDPMGIERITFRSNADKSDDLLTRLFKQDVEVRVEVLPGGARNRITQEGRGFLSKLLPFGETTTINEKKVEDGALIIRHNDGRLEVVNPPSLFEKVKSGIGKVYEYFFDNKLGWNKYEMNNKLRELQVQGKPILVTQNGMDNLGMDAVNMNDGVRMVSTRTDETQDRYGASVGVYNSTNTIFGDALKMTLGSIANRFNLPGLEASDHTWDRILESGVLEAKGNRIVAHSQGAHIATEALERNVIEGKKIEAELILAGGAQRNFATKSVANVVDLRNHGDYIPAAGILGAATSVDARLTPGTWLESIDRYWNGAKNIGKSLLSLNPFSSDPIPPKADNYIQLHQHIEDEKTGAKLGSRWGGGFEYNRYVNGTGHSMLQHLNAIEYMDEKKLLEKDKLKETSEPVK